MHKNFNRIILTTSLICFVVNYFFLIELQKLWMAAQHIFFDFRGQWALCAYTVHFVDPYPLVGIKTPLIEEFGNIPTGWSTTPWGLILGNFFYPGFLSAEDAVIYFLALNIFFLLWIVKICKKIFIADGLNFVLMALPAFFASFYISVYFGNAGAIICCLLILSCLYSDERPILAGILLALAMVKPQVALPVCFALLLRKNFKVLATAAIINFAAWGVASFMTNQPPLTLLTEFFSINTRGEAAFSGLFTLIFPENKLLAMLTSMTAGFLFIWLTWRFGFKHEKIFWAVPACLATTFFSYSFHNEFFILIMPALACLYFAVRAEFLSWKIFWLAAFVFLASGVYALFILLKNFLGDLQTDFWLARTIFAVALILLGFLMTKNFKTQCRTAVTFQK